MRIDAIGTGVQNQTSLPDTFTGKETQASADPSEVSRLNAEIEQAQSELRETMKEVQKAAGENIGGASEKAQMLQSKLLMQQQEIMTKQLQIKEIESPKNAVTEQAPLTVDARPRFDQYIAEQAEEKAPDNVYRMEEKDGARQIVFSREERS